MTADPDYVATADRIVLPGQGAFADCSHGLDTVRGMRGAIEQANKDLKEVWGAGQQQLRNVHANVGAFNLNAWLHTVVEAWAWQRSAEELVDRRNSPWDDPTRRPSHADKRKALQREVLRQEIEAVLSGPPDPQRFRELAEKLLDLAA